MKGNESGMDLKPELSAEERTRLNDLLNTIKPLLNSIDPALDVNGDNIMSYSSGDFHEPVAATKFLEDEIGKITEFNIQDTAALVQEMKSVRDGFNNNISQTDHSKRIHAMSLELRNLSEKISEKLGKEPTQGFDHNILRDKQSREASHDASGFFTGLQTPRRSKESMSRMDDLSANSKLHDKQSREASHDASGFFTGLQTPRRSKESMSRMDDISANSKLHQAKGGIIDEVVPEKQSDSLNKSFQEKEEQRRSQQSQNSSKGIGG